MKKSNQKITLLLPIILLCATSGFAQQLTKNGNSKKWFLVLPLRFTQLQGSATILSGIKAGRQLNNRFSLAASVYHSFYLRSLKATANLPGFNKQPRLYINCTGLEIDYMLLQKNKLRSSVQLLLGWGFLKYDLDAQQFKSKQLNYFAAEPGFCTEYAVTASSSIGLGIGYRPLFGNRPLQYSSDVSNGTIPVQRSFANGVNMMFTLKGIL